MKTLTAFLILLLASAPDWSIDIQSAKAEGLVGEARTGYLAPVRAPASAEVQALVRDVNAKRRAQFERTAKRTKTTLAQVSNRFYELAVQRTSRGHFYQDAQGRWVKK
ncbi:MAG: YdbL family protein [Pseudomonadota bacterium]